MKNRLPKSSPDDVSHDLVARSDHDAVQRADENGGRIEGRSTLPHRSPQQRRRRNWWLRRIDLGLDLIDWKSRGFQFVAICLALFWGCFFSLHVLHFTHRNDTDRLTWGALPFWRPLESLEYRLYDERFSSRGIVVPNCHNKIAIVAIDQQSLTRFQRWPIPRSYYARLINRLKTAGAKVIALDLDFSDYSDPRFDAQHNVILSAADKALVDAVKSAHNVVLPSYLTFDRKTDAMGNNAQNLNFLQAPVDELDAEVPDLSLAYLPIDGDGGVRRYPWLARLNPGGATQTDIGSFAGLAVAAYEGHLDGHGNKTYQQALVQATNIAASRSMRDVPLLTGKAASAAAAQVSTLLIDFWGPETFPTYSMADVLDGKKLAYSDKGLRSRFGGRIVFIGATASILKDDFSMPTFRTTSMANGIDIENSRIAGVEIHAGVAAMLMDGRFIRMASGATTLWWVFGLALFSALITAGLRDRINSIARRVSTWWIARGHRWRLHDPIWLCLYIGVAVLPVVSYWDLAVWLFSHERYCLVFVYPAMSAMFTSASILLYSFASETAERRKALAQFSRLVSPEVMEEILSHPEEQYPKPKRVYATVMFTDLEGFTTYSEGHEPEEVVEAINGLFGRLEPIVHDYGGTLDKYIGDAIMAFFGAPVPRFDHAARTLHCAIALQNECAQFRIDTGIPFYMRIGIHTGDVIVGCVGGAGRVDYTVIGDTVNLASRLEGKNKEFGSWIMCSSASHDAAPGVAIVESASTQIKGKSQAVDVFIVRGLIGDEVIDARWGHALDGARQVETIESQVQPAAPALEREGMLALEAPHDASSAGLQPADSVVAIESDGDASPH